MAEKDPAARLRRAVKENNLFLVKRLIERTDIRNTDPGPRRYTSLAWAAVLGHEETFEFLLSEGHDDYEYSRDADNNTILMLLADHKPATPSAHHSVPSSGDTMRATLRMAQLYYDRFPKVLDWSNNQGKTALHIAALKGKEELVRMLCELGADVDLPDNMGNAPLHSASAWGHIPVVQLLIERGCAHMARNNDNFTASDYAYSYTTQETLMDTVRLQFENNKRSRKLAQGARNHNNEFGGAAPSISSTYRSQGSLDIRSASPRIRSGSGTSRTTETSDSGDMEGNSLAPPLSQSSLSASSSPSHPSAASHLQMPQLAHPAQNGSMSALSPFANKVRERDADAREKYMRRNRSGSQDTSSTDNKSQNGSPAGPSTNDEPSGSTTPRRLRPSMSTSQLSSKRSPASTSQPSDSNRIRAGTNPTSSRPNIIPRMVSRSASISNSSPSSTRALALDDYLHEEPENLAENSFTGPPSQYAFWPDPPVPSEDSNMPTATTTRRLAFNPLTKPFITESHQRKLSASSFRV